MTFKESINPATAVSSGFGRVIAHLPERDSEVTISLFASCDWSGKGKPKPWTVNWPAIGECSAADAAVFAQAVIRAATIAHDLNDK